MFSAPVVLDRRDRLVAAVLGLVLVVAGSWRMVAGVCGVYHDDAIYVTTAKALADGQGYRLINLPEAPWQTKYPFLYPAVLAVVWKLWPAFPANLAAMQGLSLLAAAAALGLFYLYLVRFGYCSRPVAATAGLVCATTPLFVFFSTQTLSEMPFTLLLVAALWGLEREVRAPAEHFGRQVWLGVLLGLPCLCRTAGIPILLAGLLVLARARRRVRWVGLGSLATVAPWLVWTLAAWGAWNRDPVAGYYTDYLGWWGSFGLPVFQRVLSLNLMLLLWCSIALPFQGLSAGVECLGLPASYFLFIFLGLIPWVVLFGQLRRGKVLPWCLAAYAGLILVWPWPPQRFMVPILPVLVVYGLVGLWAVLTRFLGQRKAWAVAVSGLLLGGLGNVGILYLEGRLNHHTGYPYIGLPKEPANWASYQEVFDWLRAHGRSRDVVAAGMDSMISLYTGLPAYRPFVQHPPALFYGSRHPAIGTADQLACSLKDRRARYLVHFPMVGFAEDKPFDKLLEELTGRFPGWLKPVYIGEDQRFVIYELHHEVVASVN
jgi:hypothetical protein